MSQARWTNLGQSIVCTRSLKPASYPDAAIVPWRRVAVVHGAIFTFWVAFLVPILLSASKQYRPSIWTFLYSSYLVVGMLVFHFCLVLDGHLLLNFSGGSLGYRSPTVVVHFFVGVVACWCSVKALSANSWIAGYSWLLVQTFLAVISNYIASALLIRFFLHAFNCSITPPKVVGYLFMIFYGHEAAFCKDLDNWQDLYRVDGLMSYVLQAAGYTFAGLLNAPVYLYFRYNNDRQLGSKASLKFKGIGNDKVESPFECFWMGNRYLIGASEPKPQEDNPTLPYSTQLLDRFKGSLVSAELNKRGHMMVAGKQVLFVAMSHTWAKSGTWDRKIWLIQLRKSLGANEQSVNRYCWIDSLCVDQSNHIAVAQAVGAMGSLYTAADLVMIQDICATNLDALLLVIARYTAGTALSSLCIYTVGKHAVKTETRSDWFSRIWTLQEARLAKHLVCWSKLGLQVRMAQYLNAESIYALDTGLSEPEIPGDIFDKFSTSNILSVSQKRSTTKTNDQIYGVFGLLPQIVASTVVVDYEMQLHRVYAQVVSALFNIGDHSLLGGSEGLAGRRHPRWLPPFGTLKPMIGPCAQRGRSKITEGGLECTVSIVGDIKGAKSLLSEQFTASKYAEVICEAYVGAHNLQHKQGVWTARKYYEEDYDDGEMEDLRSLVLNLAQDRGGLVVVDLELCGSSSVPATTQSRIGFADASVKSGDVVVGRCLDGDGGTLSIIRQVEGGFIEIGGIFGGVHIPLEELERKQITLVA